MRLFLCHNVVQQTSSLLAIMLTDFYKQLTKIATLRRHRFALVLQGDEAWCEEALNELLDQYVGKTIFQLGGSEVERATQFAPFNKGQKLLGQECHLMIADFSNGFDANSFAAVTGCILGGGLLVIIPPKVQSNDFSQQWLERAFSSLLVVRQNGELPKLPSLLAATEISPYAEQNEAIEKIGKVVTGHRKRPLVLTADRGRGKTSALGIASAQLLSMRRMKILVTAPALATVQPLFQHASQNLPEAKLSKGKLFFADSSIEFIAPDELLQSKPECDLLLVDEASAIPVPLLKRMVEIYHRAVFSTTIHGYEGCGRGFTLKFQTWLKAQRPGARLFHIEQPIRWAKQDPLEKWIFDTFLLDCELESNVSSQLSCYFQRIDKATLLAQPCLLKSIFALLVNAHYQTTPNDLMLLLSDSQVHLDVMMQGNLCVGCLLSVEEGGIEVELAEQVLLAKRRPKGHLVPALLTSQLGLIQAITEKSLRVMRIAVHPELQGQGIGSQMLTRLKDSKDYSFYSTSFGATRELVKFWRNNGFQPVKLGSQRDQASGTYSLVMLSSRTAWVEQIQDRFVASFRYLLSERFNKIEIELVRSLLVDSDASEINMPLPAIVELYINGSSNYDSVAFEMDEWLKQNPFLQQRASDLIIRKLVQRNTWRDCTIEFGFVGLKQTEQQFRMDIAALASHN